MKPHRHRSTFLLLLAAASSAVATSATLAQLSSDTPEYKCFANLADQSQTVIFFYDSGDLPARFSDTDNVARAKIPNSIRDKITDVHECALRELNFSDSVGNTLESQMPQ